MSIPRRLRQFAGTYAGTLMASTLMDAAERIEALEETQPKDACDEGVKAPEKQRYVVQPHIVYVGAGGRRSTPKTSWKIYDRSRRAQSFGGVQRPRPFCVAYFYDEAEAYKVLASLNGEPTISVAEATKRIGELHAELDESRAFAKKQDQRAMDWEKRCLGTMQERDTWRSTAESAWATLNRARKQ